MRLEVAFANFTQAFVYAKKKSRSLSSASKSSPMLPDVEVKGKKKRVTGSRKVWKKERRDVCERLIGQKSENVDFSKLEIFLKNDFWYFCKM